MKHWRIPTGRLFASLAIVAMLASGWTRHVLSAEVPPAKAADQKDSAAKDAPTDESNADDASDLDRQIAALIQQLGDTQFSTRDRAQRELIRLGFDAFDALADAEQNDDPEIAMQASYLVRLIRADWTRDKDPRPIQQIFKDYELLSDENRLKRIKQLAELPGDQGLEWLCRLVRFEKSPILSKQSALAFIALPAGDDATQARREATITKALERARRPAAKWLLVHVQAQRDPAAALARWSELTEDERQTLEQHPQETQSAIVTELLRRKIDLADRLGKPKVSLAAMHQMVLCERGDSDSLTELIGWLVKRKAWPAIDDVATRFAASFEVDALLAYTLCEARLAQGNKELAEKTAEIALQVNGDNAGEHVNVAERLAERGLIEWSDREWRHVIAMGPLGAQTDVFARDRLSNSLHDRERDLEAAEVLKVLMDAADADPNVLQRIRHFRASTEFNPAYIRANMHYLFSCDAAHRGDRTAQREQLTKALEHDRTNVEALIGMYRLTADEPEERGKLAKRIKEVIDFSRSRIEDLPEEPSAYNQIAWLVANTEGDVDEAIRMSQKSVELARAAGELPKRVGGLLDTLGHCYYAKKDYENAVKYQTEAAKLDPHTTAISRQLKVFSDALAAQQSAAQQNGAK